MRSLPRIVFKYNHPDEAMAAINQVKDNIAWAYDEDIPDKDSYIIDNLDILDFGIAYSVLNSGWDKSIENEIISKARSIIRHELAKNCTNRLDILDELCYNGEK